ncbi:chitobiase/beta-hexosaminidase C-terminal domain-containing protein [Chitinivibrio alkaliphilus]|uniref:Uncharacterized protein n=1 Tax=Chitinivibrio alkaliphilus ACht1 TaxID=1313304 RepID=U7D6N7_9BACT|nr:chitobiase/beta-hexosaminidase C-terminal domain-containing protein [Chitinivibrio alkaliphilus]ERP30747.1 hypothetical protein CALK_2412 [Chitinivibrio alkaliphilus ACht1]
MVVTDPAGADTPEGESSFLFTEMYETGPVSAYARHFRYINSVMAQSDIIEQENRLPVPEADPEGGMLYADDSLFLSVDLSDENLYPDNPQYLIEYRVTYDGVTAEAVQGDAESDVGIFLDTIVDRDNRAALDFKIDARTLSTDAADPWESSGWVDFTYEIRKLLTDPSSSVQDDFWKSYELDIWAEHDFDEDGASVNPFAVPATITGHKNGDDFSHDATEDEAAVLRFTETTSFTFWAEDERYISSDSVSDNLLEETQRILPRTLADPAAGDVNTDDAYIFYDAEWEFDLYLNPDDTYYDDVQEGDFSFTAQFPDAWPHDDIRIGDRARDVRESVAIARDDIDHLISEGREDLPLTLQSISEEPFWVDSDPVTERYTFRRISLELVSDWSPEKETVTVTITAHDPVSEDELVDAEIFYTYMGETVEVESGEEFTVENGDILAATARRPGYMPADESALGIFTLDGVITIDYENRIYDNRNNEGLRIRINSNLPEVEYRVEQDVMDDDVRSWRPVAEIGAWFTVDNEEFALDFPPKYSEVRISVRGDDLIEDDEVIITGATADTSLSIRKLPQVEITPEGGDFPGVQEIQISGDRDDAEEFAIWYTKNDGDTTLYDGSFEIDASAEITAWSTAFDWLPSDPVTEVYTRETLQLPATLPHIFDEEVNDDGPYIFHGEQWDLKLFLDPDDTHFDRLERGEFDLTWRGSIEGESGRFTEDLSVRRSFVDEEIARGKTSLDLVLQTLPREDDGYWLPSETVELSYAYREMDLSLEIVAGEEYSRERDLVFTVEDGVDGQRLGDARGFYNYDGGAIDPDDEDTYEGRVRPGDTITIPNGITMNALALRSGYIPKELDDDAGRFEKRVRLEITPDDRTYYGEFLDVEITSNVVPFFYHIDGGDVVEVSRTDTAFTITGDMPDPGGEIPKEITAFVQDREALTGDLEVSHEFIRRRLENPRIFPESGDYVGDVTVEMDHGVSDVFIHYSDGDVPTLRDSEYEEDFPVTPDTILTAKAFYDEDQVAESGAGGWLASDTSRVEYRRVARPDSAALFDRTADGRVDSVAVYLVDSFPELTLPDSIRLTLPGFSSLRITDTSRMQLQEGDILGVTVTEIDEIETFFSPGEYLEVYGDRYENDAAFTVHDSIAPVLLRAHLLSGEIDPDGVRDVDTLTVRFSEPLRGLEEGRPDRDALFNLGMSTEERYSGEFSFYEEVDERTVSFLVHEYYGRLYPYTNDSIWIRTKASTDIEDLGGAVQDNPENRKVPLISEPLGLNVRMDAFWIRDAHDFQSFGSYEDLGAPMSGYTYEVNLGGAIIIDPQVPFSEEQVRSEPFDASVVILDEVGNRVVSVDGRDDSKENIQVIPVFMRTRKGDSRYVLAVLWDGTNHRGRQVHSRSYKILAATRWPGGSSRIRINGVIPVIQPY